MVSRSRLIHCSVCVNHAFKSVGVFNNCSWWISLPSVNLKLSIVVYPTFPQTAHIWWKCFLQSWGLDDSLWKWQWPEKQVSSLTLDLQTMLPPCGERNILLLIEKIKLALRSHTQSYLCLTDIVKSSWGFESSPAFLADMCYLPSQAKQDELEELNKELRQCNLQQFIQQTGVLPAHSHSRTELQDQLEQLELAQFLQDGYINGSTEPKIDTKIQSNIVLGCVKMDGLYSKNMCFFFCSPQCDSSGIPATPYCQAVPGTSTQPAKPSCVQSQPWGCVCVRPCCFPSPSCPAPLLPCFGHTSGPSSPQLGCNWV